jgi:hypothetical protein
VQWTGCGVIIRFSDLPIIQRQSRGAPGSYFLQLIGLQSYWEFSLSRCLFEGATIHNRLIEKNEEKGRTKKEDEKEICILKKGMDHKLCDFCRPGVRTFYLRMVSSGMLRRVALVSGVSEENSASFIRVTRIGELLTTLAVISNTKWYIFAACVGC